jgi:hypothetical protein
MRTVSCAEDTLLRTAREGSWASVVPSPDFDVGPGDAINAY